MAKLRLGSGFKVVMGDKRSQVAQMTLEPGAKEGGPDNRHHGADQWLFVVEGNGVAIVNGKSKRLAEGTLLLIKRGIVHEIRNSGRTMLKTLNIYVPPAYTAAGNELPRGRS